MLETPYTVGRSIGLAMGIAGGIAFTGWVMYNNQWMLDSFVLGFILPIPAVALSYGLGYLADVLAGARWRRDRKIYRAELRAKIEELRASQAYAAKQRRQLQQQRQAAVKEAWRRAKQQGGKGI